MPPETVLSNSLDQAAEVYLEALSRSATARSYLHDRGIDPDREVTHHPGSSVGEVFGLGYVEEPAAPGHAAYVGRL